jgi:hypothetical protein
MVKNSRKAFVVLVAAALAACGGSSGTTTKDPAGKASVLVKFGASYAASGG